MPQSMSFHANGVHVQDDNEELRVGFLDDERNPRHYLIIERDLAPTAQDLSLGHDDVYVEIDDQRHSAYGAIATCWLRSSSICLELKGEAATRMNIEGTVEVTFVIDSNRTKGLQLALAKLLAQRTNFIDESEDRT